MRLLDRYLLMKPSLRGVIEWGLLIICGLYGYSSSFLLLPASLSTLLGASLFVVGMVIHGLSHREHRQAHAKAEEVEKLVTTGIYSKIRHPGYLGIILAYLGAALCFQNLLAIVIAVILAALHVLTAIKEEEYLLRRFGEEYRKYMMKVKWRFIPKVY